MSSPSADTGDPAGTPPPGPAGVAVSEVVLKERIRVRLNTPLPHLDLPGAKAFAADDLKNPVRSMMARVGDSHLFPRTDIAERLHSIHDLALLRPLQWGPVEWPGEANSRFVTVFDIPEMRLVPRDAGSIMPMAPDELRRRLLTPATRVLAQFAQRGMTHRAIRPDNIYILTGESDICSLGDCVSTPAGWSQPGFVEPIEHMMADRDGRGPGRPADDIYALGVTLLILALGRNPISGIDDERLLEAKLAHGSYAALLRGERAPSELRAPLRGMLADIAAERWTYEDLEAWLNGTFHRHTEPAKELKAERSFSFAGKDYRACRALANAFGRSWESAAEAIRTVKFDSWLRRGVGNPALTMAFEDIVSASARNTGGRSRGLMMVAQLCINMDPNGPLRFKGRKLLPTAMGTALGMALSREDSEAVQSLSEIIGSRLPTDWCAQQSGVHGTVADGALFARVQKLIRQAGPGYGPERCAYELDRNVPCASPVLEGRPISRLSELLPVLDSIVESKGRLLRLIDRHLTAFIAAHSKINVDRHLAELSRANSDTPTAKLVVVKILSLVQVEQESTKTPHLARWVAQELQPLAAAFHSRTKRDWVAKRLKRLAESGDLGLIHRLLSDEQIRMEDEKGYAIALKKYALASQRIALLVSQEVETSALLLGWRIAAGVSSAIALVTLIAVTLT